MKSQPKNQNIVIDFQFKSPELPEVQQILNRISVILADICRRKITKNLEVSE